MLKNMEKHLREEKKSTGFRASIDLFLKIIRTPDPRDEKVFSAFQNQLTGLEW